MTTDTTIIELLPNVQKGDADYRTYKCFTLNSNRMTICCVQDTTSKTTAVATTVNVGAASDPLSLPGLAHFCEHMCFLGSTKYPGENEYKQYLAQHGGHSNASTSMFHTTYKFDILADYAEHAIDIYANFFIEPLFTVSGTSREVYAVDSENSKNLNADVRRRLQVLKDIGCYKNRDDSNNDNTKDPSSSSSQLEETHYYTKFSTGNVQTLLPILKDKSPDNVNSENNVDDVHVNELRDALLAFHRKHYRPENMTVVIVGPQSIEQLQEWVIHKFEPMRPRSFPIDPNHPTTAEKLIEEACINIPIYHYMTPKQEFRSAFTPSIQQYNDNIPHWPIVIINKPIRSMRKLVIMFPLPPTYTIYDASPITILSHLLGHEGTNSSFAVLQNLGYITALSTGTRTSTPDFSLFQIDISLTELGETLWEKVVHILFVHIQVIRDSTITNPTELNRIWDEIKQLNEITFHTTSPGDAYSFAPNLCQNLVLYGPHKCISAGSMIPSQSSSASTSTSNSRNNDIMTATDAEQYPFPYESVVQFINLLVPSNCFIERCSEMAWENVERQHSTTSDSIVPGENNNINSFIIKKKKEPWYGIDYYISQIDTAHVEQWSVATDDKIRKELALPRPNVFIPRTLEIYSKNTTEACEETKNDAQQKQPRHRIDKEIEPPDLLIDDNKIGRLWHRLDDRYALPKSSLTYLIRNAAIEHTKLGGVGDDGTTWQYDPSTRVKSSLLEAIFTEALAQETYDATLAGLHWDLSLSTSGIRLHCSGFSDRLPDLALKVLDSFYFTSIDFIKETYYISAKDRMERNLRTFFESRRADSYAQYYREFLLSSVNTGIEQTLEALQSITFDSIQAHHTSIFRSSDMKVDCLFSGNVTSDDAVNFFHAASKKLILATTNNEVQLTTKPIWCPGSIERQLLAGNSVELHFQSKNKQEENGSVIVSYQSLIPSYRGPNLSSDESLHSTATIRLLCHILREPLFDELRTKQTLGYIVSSYYDIGTSSAPSSLSNDDMIQNWTVPIDYVIINVLSRKLSPPDVLLRIDDFLQNNFRQKLEQLTDDEIHNYSTALSAMLLKPIQKLGVEAAIHFSKIQRLAPEIYGSTKNSESNTIIIPWDNAKLMASTIQSLRRYDILQVWDRLIANHSTSTRIVSCVYGTTFPLCDITPKQTRGYDGRTTTVVVDKLPEIIDLRKQLPLYDNSNKVTIWSNRFGWFQRLLPRQMIQLFHPFTNKYLATASIKAATAVWMFGTVSAVAAAAGWWTMIHYDSHRKKITCK